MVLIVTIGPAMDCDEPGARALEHFELELRKPLGNVDQRRAKIPGGEGRVEPDRKPAGLAAARALRSRRERFHLLQN